MAVEERKEDEANEVEDRRVSIRVVAETSLAEDGDATGPNVYDLPDKRMSVSRPYLICFSITLRRIGSIYEWFELMHNHMPRALTL